MGHFPVRFLYVDQRVYPHLEDFITINSPLPSRDHPSQPFFCSRTTQDWMEKRRAIYGMTHHDTHGKIIGNISNFIWLFIGIRMGYTWENNRIILWILMDIPFGT